MTYMFMSRHLVLNCSLVLRTEIYHDGAWHAEFHHYIGKKYCR